MGFDYEPIPQMEGLSRAIMKQLDTEVPGMAEGIGLSYDTKGDDFEKRLGEFLAWRAALPTAAGLVRAGFTGLETGQAKAAVEDWLLQAKSRSDLARTVVFNVIYELFGQSKLAPGSVASAYSWLGSTLGTGTKLAFATTNYDTAIELGFANSQYHAVSGENTDALGQTTVVVDELINCRSTEIPVLHLHGKLGWYLRPDGRIEGIRPDGRFDLNYGEPAMLLPDLDKDYSLSGFATTLWQQLDQLLARAERVLVLGHSLHDKRLVAAIRASGPPGRVGVCFHRNGQGQANRPEVDRLNSLVHGAHFIPMVFGPTPDYDAEAWESWIRGREPDPSSAVRKS